LPSGPQSRSSEFSFEETELHQEDSLLVKAPKFMSANTESSPIKSQYSQLDLQPLRSKISSNDTSNIDLLFRNPSFSGPPLFSPPFTFDSSAYFANTEVADQAESEFPTTNETSLHMQSILSPSSLYITRPLEDQFLLLFYRNNITECDFLPGVGVLRKTTYFL
jgi:hypothetical protein